jgi:NADH:ubiquinone oxidoreductase subunit 4 (subunit M)
VLAQGLSCAGLYLIVGALRRGGRVGQVKGLKLCLFVILLAAAGVPGLCNFAGEFLVVLGGWHAPAEWQRVQSPSLYIRPDIIAVIVAVAAVGYAVGFVRMLVRLAGGDVQAETGESRQLLRGERVAFAVVLAAMVGLGILPGKILKQFAPRVTSILSSAQARAADAQAHPENPARMLDPEARKAVGGVLRGFD